MVLSLKVGEVLCTLRIGSQDVVTRLLGDGVDRFILDDYARTRTEVLLHVKTLHIWILLVFASVLRKCNLRLVTRNSPLATFSLLIAV